MREKMLKDDFTTLDFCYRANIEDNEAVSALNSLPTDERNIFILYIECGCHYTEVSRRAKISVQLVKERIDEIKHKLQMTLNEDF